LRIYYRIFSAAFAALLFYINLAQLLAGELIGKFMAIFIILLVG
jgi:uncharacterized membrane protein